MPTVVIMAIGACAGSTAGGIKIIRIIICAKSVFNELVLMLHPRAVLGVRIGKQIVPDNKVRQALSFIFIYILLVVIAMTCYSLLGADVDTALGSSISMLSNVGPDTGITGPAGTFAVVPPAGKWLMSAYMLIGRLEIFTVLFLFMPTYWKDRK
jgi:trk system potassium uptake protein TrkH